MKIFPVLGLLILTLGFINPGVQAHESFRVLAIHAYSQEYPWTKSQHRGFVEELTKNSLVPVSISTEYLDTKRRAYNDEYARQFRRYLQVKYTGYKPNIIYVTDDYGYNFARNYLLKLYPDAPVIFSGVNDYSIINDIESLPIRGVFEKKDILKNLDLIHGLDKEGAEIIILGDGSSTYRVIETAIRQQLSRYPNIRVEFIIQNNMEELIEVLSSRKQEYLFLTSIGEIRGHTGLLLNPETVVSEIVDMGKFAIFTMEDSYFFDGVIGGYVTSGELQGEQAARLTLGLQRDTGVHQFDNVLDSPNTYIFDRSALNKLGITLSDEVNQKAIFHNIPPTFYEKNRSPILVISTLLIVTSITIISFLYFLRIKKREDGRKREIKRTAQLERYQNAMIAWSKSSHENIGDAFKMATEISANTLDVKRVGIWLYNEAKTSLECRVMYISGEGHSSDGILLKADFPRYFSAMETGRRIVIRDVRNDPATSELARAYLLENDVYSLLGAPIFYDRDIIGVICHEHIGEPRKWSVNEQEFSALIASDISLSLEVDKRKVIEKNLEHQAYHDSLTGLPNRALLLDRIDQAIRHARRNKSLLAVLFLDLDNFKQINDSFGHSVGDTVLVSISGMLKNALRDMDTIARLGGDEFTILLSEFEKEEEINEITAKLFDILRQPLVIKGSELLVTTSIGISVFPNDGENPEILLRNADAAMYRAKEKGRNGFEFYTEDMTERALEKVHMITSLYRALEQNEFEVYYQPQYDLRQKQLTGVEALIRWHHPDLGLISPEDFLPTAEESGLIVSLDRWTMRRAIQQMKLWGDEGVALGRLSLNLTMQQIDQSDFLEFLMDLMKQNDCDGRSLRFEITEGQLMKNPERTIELLNRISALGIKISVDDFGTGYSSLAYLKKLPVDALKIDKAFIRDIPGDEDDVSIVRSIIALAKSMRIDVLAEGVETEDQLDFLNREGCSLIQGFLFSHPKPAPEIPDLASYWVKSSNWRKRRA
jgi:diguanylate cyclase (GGDEF)-like protein